MFCKHVHYASPEILSGKALTPAYDMWCLGLILYELCFGRVLFAAVSQKTLMRQILNVTHLFIKFSHAHLYFPDIIPEEI